MSTLPFREHALATPDDRLAQEYLEGCGDYLASIRADLRSLAKGGADKSQLINRVFRAVHSVRAAAFFGLMKISELAQQMEDVMAVIRSDKLALNSYQVGILLLATERLDQLLQHADTSNDADIGRILAAIERLYPKATPSLDQMFPSDHHVLRTLAVEDDLASRLLLKSFLSRYGECDVATNGQEAVDAFRTGTERHQQYDLICMDLMMPEMGGREAVRQVRALEEAECISPAYGVKIIMVTAIDDKKEMIGCFQDFSDAYLLKPISLVSLLRHLRSYQLVR